ncbi:hypothetical protein [Rhodomicrobium sp.]|uniref:hypothetical protein n=1 Tax=Rhodomicrobium sp. TaxID=2720632 RepID=UPI0039E33D5D
MIDSTALRVLVACEFTGTVRRAFARRGFDAWSVDLLPSEDRSNHHIVGDARDYLNEGWGLLIVAHPPCTRLCNSGVRWLSEPPSKLNKWDYPAETIAAYAAWNREQRLAFMWQELRDGAELFSDFWTAPIERVAVENPVMNPHAKGLIRDYRQFAQSVQPWQFGTDPAGPDNVKKRTCLWLRGLPTLKPTGTLDGRTARADIHKASPGPDRRKRRSRFYPGLADAMADQWGGYALAELRRAA